MKDAKVPSIISPIGPVFGQQYYPLALPIVVDRTDTDDAGTARVHAFATWWRQWREVRDAGDDHAIRALFASVNSYPLRTILAPKRR